MTGMKGDLLGLRMKVIRVAVEHEPADSLHRNHVFRNEFCCVEKIKGKRVLVLFRDDLDTELILRILAVRDRFVQVSTMIVRIFSGDFLCLVPYQRMHSEYGFPMKLD